MINENEKIESSAERSRNDLIPISIEVIDIIDLENRKRYLAQIVLSEFTVKKRVEEYKKGISKNKIYEANAVIIYKSQHYKFKCFVNIPIVKKNSVGSIVANVGFMMAELRDCDFQIGMPLDIQELELIKEIDSVPYL